MPAETPSDFLIEFEVRTCSLCILGVDSAEDDQLFNEGVRQL
jgi:hypothetical protein